MNRRQRRLKRVLRVQALFLRGPIPQYDYRRPLYGSDRRRRRLEDERTNATHILIRRWLVKHLAEDFLIDCWY